jgi:hypothetical protein
VSTAGFDVGFDGTGKVLYNDHVLGTPPLVVGPGSCEIRREASSFLPGFAPLSPSIPVDPFSVKLCDLCQ